MNRIVIIPIFIITLFLYLINNIINEKTIIIDNSKVYELNDYKDYYNNDDIVGIINIEGTEINDVIVKSSDNSYYLNHNINKDYDVKGSIFLDYRTDFNSKQINIYGHNSNYYLDLPFKDLEKYLDKSFYNNHKYINIWDGSNDYIYEIFSIQIVTKDFEHMNINPSDITNHINKISKSIYDTNVRVNINDNILVLQTCNYNPINSYIVIYSKRL